MDVFEDIPECTLSIGRKLYPRLYKRFRDLRDFNEAAKWSRTLDWQNNPYDRFLLKREILRQLEADSHFRGVQNVYDFASRHEIEREVEETMKEHATKTWSLDIISYVIVFTPWRLGFKHGRIKHSKLIAAVAQTSNEKQLPEG